MTVTLQTIGDTPSKCKLRQWTPTILRRSKKRLGGRKRHHCSNDCGMPKTRLCQWLFQSKLPTSRVTGTYNTSSRETPADHACTATFLGRGRLGGWEETRLSLGFTHTLSLNLGFLSNLTHIQILKSENEPPHFKPAPILIPHILIF